MKLDYQKELVPVLYSDSGVKLLPERNYDAKKLCFGVHWHERMELLLMLDGSMKITVGADSFNAKKGSLIIISPDKPHNAFALECGVRYRPIMFEIPNFYNSAHISRRLLEPIFNQRVDFVPITENPEIIALANAILNDDSNDDEACVLITVGRVYELLGLLFRHCVRQIDLTGESSVFQSVLDYIAENYGQYITTSGLCERFGYEESYFCRLFKKSTGLTPMKYLQIYRLERSQDLLKNTDRKIFEIGRLCGFSDQNYFARCFKSQYDLTPGEYRKRQRN